MKLTKKENVQVFEILTQYKKKINNPAFIAILKEALEQLNENDHFTTAMSIHENLLSPLTIQACEELLYRMKGMGYFDVYSEEGYDLYDLYDLTELGKEFAEREIYYEDRLGLLRIYVVEGNDFIEQKIVKIEELHKDESRNEKLREYDGILDQYLENNNRLFSFLESSDNFIELDNGSYRIESIKKYYKEKNNINEQLIIETNNRSGTISVLNYKSNIDFNDVSIKDEILKDNFRGNYLNDNKIVQLKYNHENISLKRSINIARPKVENIVFDSINLVNVHVSPFKNEADIWHKALIKNRINKYIYTDDEFRKIANNIASELTLYTNDLKDSIDRKSFIDTLDSQDDFYVKSKIETIDYLNY